MNISNEIVMLLPITFKILISTICGAIVGYERELKNKRKAGGEEWIDQSLADWPDNDFRIYCSNKNLIIPIWIRIASFVASQYTGDPTRILSTIVTGIGFLGGGVIVQHEDKLIGITTAAFIWVVSAIGILCGLGLVVTPILLTLGLVGMSTFLAKYERKIRKDD